MSFAWKLNVTCARFFRQKSADRTNSVVFQSSSSSQSSKKLFSAPLDTGADRISRGISVWPARARSVNNRDDRRRPDRRAVAGLHIPR